MSADAREAWGYRKPGDATTPQDRSRFEPINEPREENKEEKCSSTLLTDIFAQKPRNNVLPFRLPYRGRGPAFPPAA